MRFVPWLAAALLAGCFGHCDYTATDVHWTDPALYDAVPGPVTPPGGMPFDGHGLDPRFAEAKVADLEYRAPVPPGPRRDHEAPWARITDGVLATGASGEGPYGEAFEAAERVLRLVTGAADHVIDEHLARLEASKSADFVEAYEENGTWIERPHYGFRAVIEVPFDLRQAWGEGDAEPASIVQRGAHTFRFSFPTVQTDLDGSLLVVDSLGQAHLDRKWPEGMAPEEIEVEVRGRLQEAGLPAPDSMSVEGYVC